MKLKLYLWILFVSMAVVFGCNALFLHASYTIWQLALYNYLNSIGIFVMDAIVATIIHKLPSKWFSPYNRMFRSYSWERRFFRAINIVGWKDYIPDTGKLTTGMSKSKIEGVQTDYLYKFLVETCYAECLHYWMAVTGIITILVNPHDLALPMMLPLALVNFALNIPPAMIQRNNRPKLLNVYEIQMRRKEKESAGKNPQA